MSTQSTRKVLVVANRTASTPILLAEVQRRAHEGAQFALLVPPKAAGDSADWSPDDARGLLERAGARDVELIDGGSDAALRVHELVQAGECGEVILSTVHHHLERWRHHDLPHRLRDLDVPLTVIPPEPDNQGPIEGFPPDSAPHAVSPAAVAGFGNY